MKPSHPKLLLLAAAALIGLHANATPTKRLLEPKIHLIYGFETGDPVELYYTILAKIEPKSIKVPGLKVKSWSVVTAFGEQSLQIVLDLKPGDDSEFDTITLTQKNGRQEQIYVGPNRVLYLKPKARNDLNFERMEQLPNERLYLGMRIFNESPKPIWIDELIYAPRAASTNRILLETRYNANWFDQLENWSTNTKPGPLPGQSKLVSAKTLKLELKPSFGFSAAVIGDSLQKQFSCKGKTRRTARRDGAFLQSVLVYHRQDGQRQLYPIPDEIVADACF